MDIWPKPALVSEATQQWTAHIMHKKSVTSHTEIINYNGAYNQCLGPILRGAASVQPRTNGCDTATAKRLKKRVLKEGESACPVKQR